MAHALAVRDESHKSSEVLPEGTVGPALRVTVQMLLNTFTTFCRGMMLEIEGLGARTRARRRNNPTPGDALIDSTIRRYNFFLVPPNYEVDRTGDWDPGGGGGGEEGVRPVRGEDEGQSVVTVEGCMEGNRGTRDPSSVCRKCQCVITNTRDLVGGRTGQTVCVGVIPTVTLPCPTTPWECWHRF
jgi:hypothetical protein